VTSPTPHHHLSLDTPDHPGAGTATLHLPSADLLARAEAGWAQFTASMRKDQSDA
jgi:hypothetical protein